MEKYKLLNLDCASCAAKIEKGLKELDDVNFVSVNFATSTLVLDAGDFNKALNKIKHIEPEVEVIKATETEETGSRSELLKNKGELFRIVLTMTVLLFGLIFEKQLNSSPFQIGKYLIFGFAYLISGYKIIWGAFKNIIKGRIFDEQFLMTIATLGAIAINQMPEAVAVMLFYVVGEFFQNVAVNRSRRSVQSLLALKPEYANLFVNGKLERVPPESVEVGQTIVVKAGEKIPLDGDVLQGDSFVDASALTGESVPIKIGPKDTVLSGMINQNGILTIRVSKPYQESSIAKILELVENAASKKAETEKFITTFARYYTPVVVFGAMGLGLLPPLFIPEASFSEWIYRALVVLVISCPCALVISIPLGYFGGIGAAAKRGILVKGSNYLDALTQLKVVVFDKTGTLTKGEFSVSSIVPEKGFSAQQLLHLAAKAEAHSNHPIATAILKAYKQKISLSDIKTIEEISGNGIIAQIEGQVVCVGNDRLLHRENIKHPRCEVNGTVLHVAIDGTYAGHIIISDTIKDDAFYAIKELIARKITPYMLTGDNRSVATAVARQLNIKNYFAELLPQDKVDHLERIMKEQYPNKVAFVGDGINDAPVLARADVGFAMGALGADAAIETADVVLMADYPTKIIEAIDVAGKTRKIVWQNILFSFGVKLLFIGLGVVGMATMWEAVFGDMGVTLLAIFNAMRIKK